MIRSKNTIISCKAKNSLKQKKRRIAPSLFPSLIIVYSWKNNYIAILTQFSANEIKNSIIFY